jgi:predicted CXXCH cytochrome family protein
MNCLSCHQPHSSVQPNPLVSDQANNMAFCITPYEPDRSGRTECSAGSPTGNSERRSRPAAAETPEPTGRQNDDLLQTRDASFRRILAGFLFRLSLLSPAPLMAGDKKKKDHPRRHKSRPSSMISSRPIWSGPLPGPTH